MKALFVALLLAFATTATAGITPAAADCKSGYS